MPTHEKKAALRKRRLWLFIPPDWRAIEQILKALNRPTR
jgi:hypothetical protein